mmetsp:Transcript_27823/g.45904  ORF Transcript_27823/g.45904 Transcript_27823/m.45904 type:complete len:248 (-) Transcript_27823:103-846(-)
MKRRLLHVLLLLVVIFTLILPEYGCDARKLTHRERRRRRKYRRDARMFGLSKYLKHRLKRHERNQCSYRNCYITKQQNMLQTLMGDYIFKSIAMAPPIDITDAKYKKQQSHADRLINRFPAFIQGDIGRLRRRNLEQAQTLEQAAVVPSQIFAEWIMRHPLISSSSQMLNIQPRQQSDNEAIMPQKSDNKKKRGKRSAPDNKTAVIAWITLLFSGIIIIMAWCSYVFEAATGDATVTMKRKHTHSPV